ncbi:unnamed protein product [Prunus armeniaca]
MATNLLLSVVAWYSLHINCGGKEVTVFGKKITTFNGDTDSVGSSSFRQSSTNWALSSTGCFTDDNHEDTLIQNNETILSMANPKLYMNARLSPISLTYFGFCLGNGDYTVNLHFAETRFTNGKTYKSLGRCIFDVYIQGIQRLKDFNIADEAGGGVGKAVIKNFYASVTNGTLEIRFYWAGKGTTGIPVTGVYGPLISAISGVDLRTGKFSFRQLKDATNNFDKANKILNASNNVALLCCYATSTIRPTMSSVVSMLEGRAAVQILVSDPNASNNEMDAMRKHFESTLGMNTSECQIHTASSQGPLTGSSTSVHDLYPVIPDSTY